MEYEQKLKQMEDHNRKSEIDKKEQATHLDFSCDSASTHSHKLIKFLYSYY